MKINLIPIALLLISVKGVSQEAPVLSNSGTMYVAPGTEVMTMFSFDNKEAGFLTLDGSLYLMKDYNNDGIFGPSKSELLSKDSKVFFMQDGNQLVSGKSTSFFKNIVFENKGTNLKHDIAISGVSDYESGIVVLTGDDLAVTYEKGGKVGKISDASFVDGLVERVGSDELVLPIGNKGKYRTAIFGDKNSSTDVFTGQYFFSNPLDTRPHSEGRSSIQEIDGAEYWEVKKVKGSDGLLLSLSWNEATTPASILAGGDDKLAIVRWDEATQKWISEGGMVDAASKLVTIPVEVGTYGIFTLGRIDKKFIEDDSVIIYNAVSPNGDGDNDYFYVKNINLFPNNTVRIYNRWGAKVYETSNYDPNGNGTANVFSGKAEGKGVLGKDKLPSGTYFYDVRYEKTDKNGSEMIKKSGYLHLEND